LANNGLGDTHKIGLISLEGLKNTAKISSGQLTLANNIEYTISRTLHVFAGLAYVEA
jgi:hypothetical protein